MLDSALSTNDHPLEAHDPSLEFRSAELRAPVEGWPAGTRGVIVDAFQTKAAVEIMDRDGETLDLLSVPYGALSVEGR
jgi:hypothetical protein